VAAAAAAVGVGWLLSAPSSPDPIIFEDVATRAGVKFVLLNAAAGDKHQIETMVSGVAVFDYNNDGWPDIYFVNGAAQPKLEKSNPSYYNRLYRNKGDGTFEDVTEQAGVRGRGFEMGVAAGDYNNDGAADLFIAGVYGNTLYRNRGDGTFEDATAKAGLAQNGS
jgi:enediyne biosynthesis protein E4